MEWAAPVMERASWETRNMARAATSSGSIRLLTAAGSSITFSMTSCPRESPAGAGLVCQLGLKERCPHVGRADGVDRDTVPADLQRDRLREADEAVLGRDVGRLVGAGDQPVYRGHVDDPAPGAPLHSGYDGLGELERGNEHDLDQPRPLVVGEVLDRGDMLEPGVVDEDVDMTVDLHGPPSQRRRLLHAGEVGLQEVGADLPRRILRGGPHVVDEHAGPCVSASRREMARADPAFRHR